MDGVIRAEEHVVARVAAQDGLQKARLYLGHAGRGVHPHVPAYQHVEGMAPLAVAAEMRRDDAKVGEGVEHFRHLVGAGRVLLRRKPVADMDHEHEVVLGFLENGEQARVVQPVALKIRVELEAAHAVDPQPVELRLPVRAVGMDGAEGRYLGVGVLKIAGVAVAGLYLRSRGGGTERDDVVDAAALGPYEKVFGRSLAAAVQPVLVLQHLLGLFRDMGMEHMGMDIDEHGTPSASEDWRPLPQMGERGAPYYPRGRALASSAIRLPAQACHRKCGNVRSQARFLQKNIS